MNKLIEGPVILAGNWEPLIHRRRINQPYSNLSELYEQEHTSECVQHLKDAEVNLLVTHFFKGYGLAAEAEDIENARKLIKLCHEHNIFVGGYIGDTLILETLLNEEPQANEWIQRKENGDPVRYAGTQSFRYKWCIVNPGYFQYISKVLVKGIEAGLDLIHFDNFLNKPEPESCHCHYCVDAFRNFLRNKYSESELKERLGHSNCSHINPPTFTYPLYIAWQKEIIMDPITQEWIDFKCQTLADTYRELAKFCRNLNPDIAIECNPTGFWGENSQYIRSVDHVRLLPHGNFFWDESPNKFGLQDNGALRTNIISMKMGDTLNNRIFFYVHGDSIEYSEMKMGEALACNNGCLGMVGFLEGNQVNTRDISTKYADFLQKNPQDFCNTKSMAKTAIYRNFPSSAYNAYEPYLQTILCQQTLLQNHIPFDIIWDLDDTDQYSCIILPGQESLSPQGIQSLIRFTENGGSTVLIGDTGIFDKWRRKYPVWPFENHLDGKTTNQIGNGHLIKLDELLLPNDAPGKNDREIWDDWYPVLDSKFWLLPKNPGKLLNILTDVIPGLCPIEVNASQNTIIESRMGTDNILLIHIINYSPEELGSMLDFSTELPVEKISILNPHKPEPKDIPCKVSNGKTAFSVNNDYVYSLIKIT